MIGFYAAGAMGTGGGGPTPPGGYPQITNATPTQIGTGATSHSVPLPAVVNAGDGLLMQLVSDGSSTNSAVTTPSGWTAIGTQQNSNRSHRVTLLWRVASGSEGGTNVTIGLGGSEELTALVTRVHAGTYQGTPEAQLTQTANISSPTNPTISPSWGSAKTKWIVGLGMGEARTATMPYPNNQVTADLVSTAILLVCSADVETASFSPSAWSLNSSTYSTPFTVGIRPA